MLTLIRPAAEWQSALERVAPFAAADPESDLHRVGLKVFDGRLRWIATDGYRMAVLDAGPVDLPDSDVRLSPIQVAFAASQVAGSSVAVEIDDELDIPLVQADGVSCGMMVGRDGWPDIDEVLAQRTAPHACANVRVSTATLRGVLSAISYATSGADGLHLALSVGDREMLIAGTDGGSGVFRFVIECETDVREITPEVGVQPELFASLLTAVEGETISLTLPLDGHRAVSFSDGNWSAHLMPMTPAGVVARAQLETAVEDAFDPDNVELNEDRSYTLDRDGTHLRISVREGDDPVVVMGAVLVSDVTESLELLREVNEFNRGAQSCRAHVADRKVIVESELSLVSLDGNELEAAAERLSGLVARLTPLMTMFFVD